MKIAAAIALVACAGFAAAQPATAFDFGAVNGMSSSAGSLASGEVVWFSVEVGAGATFLDIDTNGSGFDTELGIYDSAGNLVANDDDDGVSTTSVLTFGVGSGEMLGDSFNLGGDGIADGEDGALPSPGTYYIALGGFNTIFNAGNFSVDAGTSNGDYSITVRSDVPAPATAALLGLGGLVATRRRR